MRLSLLLCAMSATAVHAAGYGSLDAPATAPLPTPGPEVLPYVAMSAPVIALRHVNVIDGTGSAPRADQTIVFERGHIMDDHFYYSASNALQRGDGKSFEPGFQVNEIAFTAPRLYLAGGVTTLRTTGSVEPYTDIKVHDRIEAGLMPGPDVELTAPCLEGGPTPFAQMRELKGAEDARRFVAFWAESGMTSFKAYMNITRDELAAAAADGLLLAGADPTDSGGVLPGFGNQREIELLVEAGFAPVAAIQIATQNGARYLRREADIEDVELVFKDGIGYDSARLIESVRGQVGVR
jgi:hypothetical protein